MGPLCNSRICILPFCDRRKTGYSLTEGAPQISSPLPTTNVARTMTKVIKDNHLAWKHRASVILLILWPCAISTLKTFDYVVANRPFSDKRWSTGLCVPLTESIEFGIDGSNKWQGPFQSGAIPLMIQKLQQSLCVGQSFRAGKLAQFVVYARLGLTVTIGVFPRLGQRFRVRHRHVIFQ